MEIKIQKERTKTEVAQDPLIFRSRGLIVGSYKSRAMTYTAKLKVQFDTEWTPSYSGSGIYDNEILPEEHYTFEIPCQDVNTIQLFRFFGTIARTMGHHEEGIMKGACSLAFNDMRSEGDMRKVAEEFELMMAEDYSKELRRLEDEIYDLKAKLSRCQQPDNPDYTEEEMEAMTAEQHKEWSGLVPGSHSAVEKGCKCPIMDNEDMPDGRKWVNGDCPLHGKVK